MHLLSQSYQVCHYQLTYNRKISLIKMIKTFWRVTDGEGTLVVFSNYVANCLVHKAAIAKAELDQKTCTTNICLYI